MRAYIQNYDLWDGSTVCWRAGEGSQCELEKLNLLPLKTVGWGKGLESAALEKRLVIDHENNGNI